MSLVEVNVTIDMDDLLRKPETRAELFDMLLSNQEFINALADYIGTGMTEGRSWAWDVDGFRERMLKAFDADVAADLMRRINAGERREERMEKDHRDLRLKHESLILKVCNFFDSFAKANVQYSGNTANFGVKTSITLTHERDAQALGSCPACKIVKAISRYSPQTGSDEFKWEVALEQLMKEF